MSVPSMSVPTPDAEFVDVYSKTTGVKQTVPADWLDHPVLGQDFRRTPLSAAQQREAAASLEASGPTNTPA